ncbi:hemerythrin domain-containing protein [Azospirillum sp. TSO35-2]|uniref:bacteriohemerythrin n=1 Tax=Azospirillum sp. TSO35-2 TaxID=716796 RepID=UPI000D620D7B|nr:hemerythrin domain-containing protein [Azospirillum sp. TSO35-2]PWC37680.1 hypothetical protein TSO352_09175 [Azospirillum sp. TSO35-2]
MMLVSQLQGIGSAQHHGAAVLDGRGVGGDGASATEACSSGAGSIETSVRHPTPAADGGWRPGVQPLQWSPALATGIPDIDLDHSILVALFNDLGHALQSQVSDHSQRTIATDTARFLRQHLKREEAFLARYQHPLITEHLQQHDRCDAAMIDLEAHMAQGLKMTAVVHLLHDWIVEHMMVSDRELFGMLQERPSDFAIFTVP